MRQITMLTLIIGLIGYGLIATADDQAPVRDTQANPSAQVEDAPAADPSAEEVLNELLRRREENPLIEPARPRVDSTQARQPGAAQPLGTAPGVGATKLKREGQFIITRRARMVQAATGGTTAWMLVFESDKDGLGDPPMFVLPCQMLEDMENIVEDRGDSVTFIISGQVFVYRGANYLLPTLMKLAPNMGNLKP